MTVQPWVRIDLWEMRCRFNKGRYWERTRPGGDLRAELKKQHLASPQFGQPPGTMSQELYYYDTSNREVARVQQFVLPDGTIGASGRPDPTRLVQNGVRYRLKKGAKDNKPEPATALGRAVLRVYVAYRQARCFLFGY